MHQEVMLVKASYTKLGNHDVPGVKRDHVIAVIAGGDSFRAHEKRIADRRKNMVHKKPDRRIRRELRRASRPPSTTTRKTEVWFYITLVTVVLIFAAVILLAVS